LVIGGVLFEGGGMGPVGHSDADVLLHALTDALLGALGLPDIGQMFPDTDPRWRDADSGLFVREAVARVRGAGWEVANLDATVVAQRPKIGPRKAELRASLAALLGIDEGRINVKGKTHEGVDAVGEGRAIEAHAVVLLARA
jgi:2-C-methyl-D-erythritol 2,4-cyclodiphosphate synthase